VVEREREKEGSEMKVELVEKDPQRLATGIHQKREKLPRPLHDPFYLLLDDRLSSTLELRSHERTADSPPSHLPSSSTSFLPSLSLWLPPPPPLNSRYPSKLLLRTEIR